VIDLGLKQKEEEATTHRSSSSLEQKIF